MWPVVIASAVLPVVGLDRYGDPLPLGATARLGTTHLRVGWVGGLHFAPDDNTFRGVTSELAFTEWDVATGRRLRTARWPRRLPKYPAWAHFSADGAVCVCQVVDGDQVAVAETATGRVRSEFRLPHQSAASCGHNPVSPDGRYFVTYDGDPWAEDREKSPDLLIWDTTIGRSKPVPRDGRGVSPDSAGLIFAPDGRFLVSSGTESVCYDPATGRPLWTAPIGAERYPRFSPDGKWLATDFPRLELLDATTGKPADRIPPPRVFGAEGVGFSPDGRLLLWYDPQTKKQHGWNIATGREEAVPAERYPGEGHWTVSRNGRLGICQASQVFEVWDLTTRTRIVGDDSDHGHRHPVEAIAVSKNGVVATVNEIEEAVRLWDARDGRPIATVPLPGTFDVNAAQFTPDGRRLVIGYGHSALPIFTRQDYFGLAVIDVPAAKVERTIRYKWGFGGGLAGTVFGPFVISADGTRVEMTCCADGATRKENTFPWAVASWELETGRQLPARSLGHVSADSTQLGAFSPDGRLVAAGRHVLDAKSGRVVAPLVLKADEGLHDQPAFSADGRVVAAPVAETGPPAHPQFTYGGRTNGPWLGVRVWDAATGRELARLPVPEHQTIALTPDGRSVLALGDDLTVWDVATGRPRAVRSAGPSHTFGDDRDVAPLAVSPDGRFAVTAPPDGTALVWDIGPSR